MPTFPAKINYAAGNVLTAAQMVDIGNGLNDLLPDAKGSLTTVSAANTPAQLTVGNNGETLVADSSTSTGLRYNPIDAAGKNYVINGNFDIWQRGTSFSGAGYFADRWTNIGDINAVTATQQTSGAPAGSRYYLRLTSTAGSSYWSSYQFMETSQIAPLWGKTVTLSVKLRRNSTMNNSGVNYFVQKSATVDAGSGASWTTIGTAKNVPLLSIPTGSTSSDWVTDSTTISIPNDGTANSLRVIVQYNGATASGSVLEVAQVQLEVGSVATNFSRAGGTLAGELAACQRYYVRFIGSDGNDILSSLGWARTTTDAHILFTLPTTMRITPTAYEAANVELTDLVNEPAAGTITLSGSSTPFSAGINCATTGLTQYRPYVIRNDNNAAGYVAFTAEL